jgi:hypothetical protein
MAGSIPKAAIFNKQPLGENDAGWPDVKLLLI